MKWYLIHSHSVETPKPAMAELLAEGLIPKAFNWPVIRLCGPAGQVATTEEREKDLGELQLTVKKEGKKPNPLPLGCGHSSSFNVKGREQWRKDGCREKSGDRKISLDEFGAKVQASFACRSDRRATVYRTATGESGVGAWFLSQPVIIHEETFYSSWLPRS